MSPAKLPQDDAPRIKPSELTEVSLDEPTGDSGAEPSEPGADSAEEPNKANNASETTETAESPEETKTEADPAVAANADAGGDVPMNGAEKTVNGTSKEPEEPKKSEEPKDKESEETKSEESKSEESKSEDVKSEDIKSEEPKPEEDKLTEHEEPTEEMPKPIPHIAEPQASEPQPSESQIDSFPPTNQAGATPKNTLNVDASESRARSLSIRRSRHAVAALTQSVVNGAEAKPAKLFLQNAFEKIRTSKDAKRIPALHTATVRVMEVFEHGTDELPSPKMILEPLSLVCTTAGCTNELKEVAIDTLGRLFALNYFAVEEDPATTYQLLNKAVFITSDAWDAEGADAKVEVQIIKALTEAVVNEELVIHGSVLMNAVRQVYHIFAVTRSQLNQSLAQGSLTQMVQAVFERVKSRYQSVTGSSLASKTASYVDVATEEGAGDTADAGSSNKNNRSSPKATAEGDAAITLKDIQSAQLPDIDVATENRSELEASTQDAGLLFRTLCRLSTKPFDESDMRSQQMRSKLQSLHLIHMILKHHISVFRNHKVVVRNSRSDPEPLAYTIKPFLLQAMAHNSLSPIPAAFEITAEIFWLVLANLRSEFKPELAVFFTEVYFTAMDMRTATMHQRLYFMTVISRICTDPRLLVELYLNYDCDPSAQNVFERLMELTSRLALKPATEPAEPAPAGSRLSIDRQQIRVYDLNAPPAIAIAQLVANPPPSASAQAAAAEADNYKLKVAALEAIVNVLRSLVLWSQRENGAESSARRRADSTVSLRSLSSAHSGNDASTSASGTAAASGTVSGDAGHNASSATIVGSSTNSSAPNTPTTTTTTTAASAAGASRHRVTDSVSTVASHRSLGEDDDPDQFASRKKNKRVLDTAVQEFNFSPARGLRKFVEAGLLSNPEDATEVARLLLNTDGLDKAKLGDYLGKNGDFNQQVMMQFVSAMNFHGLTFVQALRRCLQRFRLPGEGQVIDRYMQTFAKKYFEDNSVDGVHPIFASADAAWVLAMSVMMLNTDLHAKALRRRRMTDEQFIRNNKGMNDGEDFRADVLMDIYTEIQKDEIKLDSEQTEVAIRDEAYDVASDVITSRAAQVFKSGDGVGGAMGGATDYYNASHAAHIRPMFELTWLAILAGVSNPFSQLARDESALAAVLEGLELALRIACHFDVEIARVAFVQTLAQDTLLAVPAQMEKKNFGALHSLLRVALAEADSVRESWYDVLTVVSQLELAQLRAQQRVDASGNAGASGGASGSGGSAGGAGSASGAGGVSGASSGNGSIVNAASAVIPRATRHALLSRELVVMSDRIFAQTADLTNEGAVFFVKALSRVSLEEIQSSRTQAQPRLFALQKMVDVCYYNSARIRMGWSEMWNAAMAEQFAKVLVDPNLAVVMFALDSLRQLSMRFLEIDEMPHFAFQREFLAPFGHALRHSKSTDVKVMALECLTQIVRTRSDKLKSGWEAVFAAVSAAVYAGPKALEAAYALLLTVPTTDHRVPPGFLDACAAIAEQPEIKTALRAVDILHRLVEARPHDISLLQNVLKHFSAIALQGRDLEVRGRCLEVLFKLLNENGRQFQRDDWDEVFRNSLGPLFSVLHGQSTRRARADSRSPRKPLASAGSEASASASAGSAAGGSSAGSAGDVSAAAAGDVAAAAGVSTGSPSSRRSRKEPNTFPELLAPPQLSAPQLSAPSQTSLASPSASSTSLAVPPTSSSGRSRSPSPSRNRMMRAREEMSLWLSSTMIQALKSVVALFASYFELLEHALATFFLPLLKTCILQDNDAVSRMGNSCFQMIVQQNAARLNATHWHQITSVLVELSKDTTATQLMDRAAIEAPELDARELFRTMTSKTMQGLLLMGTMRELLVNSKEVFDRMPLVEILRVTTRLRASHQFAREFNHQNELRLELYQRGFFRQTPNLLHQESQAGQIYVSISMRLFKDKPRFETDPSARQDLADELMPFCNEILADYNSFRESEPRHITKFMPIVGSILDHILTFEDTDFTTCAPEVSLHAIDVIEKPMTPALKESVQAFMRRITETWVLKKETK